MLYEVITTKGFATYRYEQSEILNVDPTVTSQIIRDAEGKSTHSSIMGEIVRNSTDFHQDPSRGGISKFTLQYAGLGGTDRITSYNVCYTKLLRMTVGAYFWFF